MTCGKIALLTARIRMDYHETRFEVIQQSDKKLRGSKATNRLEMLRVGKKDER